MICPILYPIGDQQFWGVTAFKKGIAVEPIPISKMTEKKFIGRVSELITNKELYNKATEMKTKVDMENGIQKAIDEIEKTTANISG